MKFYSGIICAIVGTLLLLLSYVCGWVDYNWIQFIAILIIAGGIGAHIYVNYKKPEYTANENAE